MKEAKDKAEELIEKFTNYYGLDSDLVNDEKAIQCALICVDEILKLYSLQKGKMIAVIKEDYDFWNEVKQEILNRQ